MCHERARRIRMRHGAARPLPGGVSCRELKGGAVSAFNGLSSVSPLEAVHVHVCLRASVLSYDHSPLYMFCSYTHTVSCGKRSYGRGPLTSCTHWVYRCTGNAMHTIQRPWVHKGGSFRGYESPELPSLPGLLLTERFCVSPPQVGKCGADPAVRIS